MSLSWMFSLLAAGAVILWPSRRRTVGWAATDRPRWVTTAVGVCRSVARGVRHCSPLSPSEHPTSLEVADTLELLSLAVRSGLSLTDSVQQVERCSLGPVRLELAAVVAALRWGRPAPEAWSYGGPGWRPAALAWAVAEETGAPAAELLAQAAQRQREADDRAAERRAARAGVLLVLPLGLGFLPSFVCVAVVPVLVVLARGVLG